MPSIYDSYQVAQSQQARPYLGNNLSELRELGNEMQRRYDTTVATMDNIDMLARQVSTDPKSDAALKETLQGVRSRLEEYAQRPDKENLLRPTSILARDFAADAQTFMGNQQAIQGWREEIDKRDDVDRNTKEKTKALAMLEYQGLQRDPNSGRLVNPFRGSYNPPKSIDSATFVNKVGEGIKADAGGSTVRQVRGDYYVEVGGEWKKVSPERVAAITRNLINSDPEMQAYLDYQAMLAGKEALYSNKIRSIEDVPNTDLDVVLPDGKKSKINLRQRVQEYMDTNKVDANTAVANLEATNRKKGIINDLTSAAVGKFAFQEQSSTNKVMGETEAATRAATEPLRFMITAPSNVATGELQNMNIGDLEDRMADTEISIDQARAQLTQLIRSNAAPSDIEAAQNQLRSLQDQRTAAASVRDNTKNEAARQLGYNNYQDYVTRNVGIKIQDMVKDMRVGSDGKLRDIKGQVFDANGNPTNERGITPSQLQAALQQGAVRRVDMQSKTGIPGNDYYEVPLTNGQRVRIPVTSGDDMMSMVMYNTRNEVFSDFNKKTKELFKDAKTLNYSTHQINIGEKDGSEILGEMYKSDPNAFTVYDRSGKPVDADDLPPDLKLTSVNVVKGGNGSVMLQAYREEKDKKGNVSDRDYYTVVPNPNNNVGSILGARISKDADKVTDPVARMELKRAGVQLMGDDWDGILSTSALNQSLPIRDAYNNTIGYVRRERSEANPKNIVYRFYDPNEKLVMRPGPDGMLKDISLSDITKAANAIRGSIQNANKARAAQNP